MTDDATRLTPQAAASRPPPQVAVIGAGPAGLRAAEALQARGAQVDVYDAMPSAGRKFLLAGIGGLNLTHSEPLAPFVARYGERQAEVGAWLAHDGAPQALRDWAAGLGVKTFVGSSGRVFPTDLKAAPLLRAWLHRLRGGGPGRHAVRFHTRHRWLGWQEDGALRFDHRGESVTARPDATVLALGGASWSRLGSDGAWVAPLRERGVDIAPLRPANCGFDIASRGPDGGWSPHLRNHFAGAPIKPVALALPAQPPGAPAWQPGEFVLTETGIEGSLVYAFSARLRDEIAASGSARLWVDLLPQHPLAQVAAEVARPRGTRSLSTHLKSRLGLAGAKMALLHECLDAGQIADPQRLAAAIKALPLTLRAARPIDEAISTAGGVRFEALTEGGMLRALPGVFCAGEMIDWEAPTGGYLLTACIASGRAAGEGVMAWWQSAAAS